jgi:glucose dehydrogenase
MGCDRVSDLEVDMTAQQFMNYIDSANPDKVLAIMLLAVILWGIWEVIARAWERISG